MGIKFPPGFLFRIRLTSDVRLYDKCHKLLTLRIIVSSMGIMSAIQPNLAFDFGFRLLTTCE